MKIKMKNKGGALLIFGLYEDYTSNLIDKKRMFLRIELIKHYEAGLLTLQQLNADW